MRLAWSQAPALFSKHQDNSHSTEALSNLQPPSLPHYSQPTNPSNAHPTPILLLVAFFCLEVQFNQPSRVYETRPLAPHSSTL